MPIKPALRRRVVPGSGVGADGAGKFKLVRVPYQVCGIEFKPAAYNTVILTWPNVDWKPNALTTTFMAVLADTVPFVDVIKLQTPVPEMLRTSTENAPKFKKSTIGPLPMMFFAKPIEYWADAKVPVPALTTTKLGIPTKTAELDDGTARFATSEPKVVLPVINPADATVGRNIIAQASATLSTTVFLKPIISFSEKSKYPKRIIQCAFGPNLLFHISIKMSISHGDVIYIATSSF